MKTFLAVLFFGFLSSSIANAADVTNEVLHFKNPTGYLGFNFASASTNAAGDLNNYTGFVIGARMEGPISPNFYFVPGLQIANRGFGFTDPVLARDATVHITYFELPMLFMIRLPSSGGSVIPYFIVGPTTSLKLGSGCSVEGADSCTLLYSDHIRTVDFAFDMGAGSEIPLGTGHALNFDLMYHLGLTNFVGDYPYSFKNRGIEFLVGYQF
jgi:hypothetical protein